MNLIEDLIKNIQLQVSERLTSPLMGSFAVSWCLWNYKFLVILFSDASVTHTFRMIETIAFPTWTAIALFGLVYPLLTAAAYIFIYPYPAKYVFEFTRKRQKEIIEIRRRIEEETPLTLEESRKLRAEIDNLEQAHLREIERRDRELERFRLEIAKLEKQAIPSDSSSDKEPEPAVSTSQLNILRLVEKLKGKAPEKTLLAQSKESQVKTEYDLGELVRLEFIERKFGSDISDYYYRFTQKGRSYLVEQAANA